MEVNCEHFLFTPRKSIRKSVTASVKDYVFLVMRSKWEKQLSFLTETIFFKTFFLISKICNELKTKEAFRTNSEGYERHLNHIRKTMAATII